LRRSVRLAQEKLLGRRRPASEDLYLEERGGALDEAGRTLVESERESWFSLLERSRGGEHPLQNVGILPSSMVGSYR
jgi:hypothetical protein